MIWSTIALGLLALGVLGLSLWRYSDVRAERAAWNELLSRAGTVGQRFDPAVLDGLPELARAWFKFTIAPGTPLVSIAEIDMKGQLGLGTSAKPGYAAMQAKQILFPPQGLVWRLRTGAISGSDGITPETSWTRFWLFGLFPVARVSGTPDHHRSAFGRLVAEGAFWMPSSLLPGRHVVWESVGENVVRASITYGNYSQSIDLTIEPDGRPSRIVLQRWSNANAQKVYREQPFGGYLSNFQLIGGYRLPMHVEGGNYIGTDEYFPFYKAEVQAIRFPQLTAATPTGIADSR